MPPSRRDACLHRVPVEERALGLTAQIQMQASEAIGRQAAALLREVSGVVPASGARIRPLLRWQVRELGIAAIVAAIPTEIHAQVIACFPTLHEVVDRDTR